MEGTDPVARRSWLGRVEIAEPGALMSSPGPGAGHDISRTRYAWRPGQELGARLPRGFRLEIDGLTGPDGTRRFRPAQAFGTFVVKASLGGLAVLARQYGLDAEGMSSYDTMRLIFQQAPRLREHLARAFGAGPSCSSPARSGPATTARTSCPIGWAWGPIPRTAAGRSTS